MSSVIINASLVFAVDVDWSFVLLAMEELLSLLIIELLVIALSDFFSLQSFFQEKLFCDFIVVVT